MSNINIGLLVIFSVIVAISFIVRELEKDFNGK